MGNQHNIQTEDRDEARQEDGGETNGLLIWSASVVAVIVLSTVLVGAWLLAQ